MTWFDTFADDEQQSVEQLQEQGIKGKPAKQKEEDKTITVKQFT